MLNQTQIPLNRMVDILKAAGESSRLRILVLLSRGDLTVSDMTEILNQSQPRVSRHLKLLTEAGLVERYQEGSWAWFRLSDSETSNDIVPKLVERLEFQDFQIERDIERMEAVKTRLRNRATEYFAANASQWDELRKLHASDDAVEKRLLNLMGDSPVQTLLDLGTGTGRMLEIFAGIYQRAVGIDTSREMLAVARANLDRAGITHAQVRLGDLLALPVDRENFDLITIHQVLHYLDDPAAAISEAARALRPGGRMVIVDFAPHELEFLREEHHHIRMGFSDEQVSAWFTEAGIELCEHSELAAPGNARQKLAVRIWIGRDPRILVADNHTVPALSEIV